LDGELPRHQVARPLVTPGGDGHPASGERVEPELAHGWPPAVGRRGCGVCGGETTIVDTWPTYRLAAPGRARRLTGRRARTPTRARRRRRRRARPATRRGARPVAAPPRRPCRRARRG